MDTSEFGFWAMLVFWGMALGSIALGISLATRKGNRPVNREFVEKSLKRRLKTGEISRELYDQKLKELDDAPTRH